MYEHVPKGFIPAEDGGYLIIAVQAPPGASLEYTTDICSQVETILATGSGNRQRIFRGRIQFRRQRFESRADFHRPKGFRSAQR